MARANIIYMPTPLLRPLQNGTFCPISASNSNFNPRNILYIPVVEIFAFLELEQKLPFFKGLFLFILLKKYEDGLNNDSYIKDYFGAKTITKVRPSNFGLCSITAISSVCSTI